ncbi:phage protease [Mycolicibacterium septicum]|uniref:Phage protease n=1 Tax=Mycolicibacterium septicum TaxID=98668 RepID=A0ABW9LRB4_9MYCO
MALSFNDDQAADLLDTLGLPADTTDIAVALATVKDAVTAAAPTQPSAIAAAAKQAGLEVVDSDTMAALRNDAAEGRRIQASVARQKIEDTVINAVNKGKITPARKDHWVNLITADPAMAEVLNAVPDETAVPLSEMGHGVGNEDGQPPRADWFY